MIKIENVISDNIEEAPSVIAHYNISIFIPKIFLGSKFSFYGAWPFGYHSGTSNGTWTTCKLIFSPPPTKSTPFEMITIAIMFLTPKNRTLSLTVSSPEILTSLINHHVDSTF